MAKFIKKALRNEPLEIFGDGTQTRDFVFIDDLIEVIIRAGTVPGIGGEVFQIATATESTVQEVATCIVDAIRQKTGREAQVSFGNPRQGDALRSVADVSKARRMLGFSPETTLTDGIGKTVEYFLGDKVDA